MSRRSWTDDANKDSESHQHFATEQELKVAEKAKEHQVEIEAGTEVEEEQQHKANEV